MRYLSTRGNNSKRQFTDILLEGLAPDGGLYLPENFPKIDINSLEGKPYIDIAQAVISPYLDSHFQKDDFKKILEKTYSIESGIFDHKSIAPLVQIDDNIWIMELFKGPTIAFKDVALQLLGNLFDYILEQRNEKITIVGATSGDTGSAAIEACKNCKNIDIFIMHPKGKVSDVQRKQMTTIDSNNVYNIAIEGNFDDCQSMVKAMFADKSFRDSQNLSAVNSINWARIIAQAVYYVSGALALGGSQRKINFAVPTGNFGNILAGYVAKQMGVNIDKLIIGSNKNDILTRFYETGKMKKEDVIHSISPSMDIGISSNFERYLYLLSDRNPEILNELMASFNKTGEYEASEEMMTKFRNEFISYRCDDKQTNEIISKYYKETGYLLDPHTAVGLNAAINSNQDKSTPIISLGCAHPAKFPDAVKNASGVHPDLPDKLGDLFEKEEIYDVLPNDMKKVQEYIKDKTGK